MPSPPPPPVTPPPATRRPAHLHPSDLRAAAQLATSATRSVARIAEGVNQAVWSTLGAPSGKAADQTRGITGLVYRSVQGITGLVGKSIDTALAKLLPHTEQIGTTSAQREAVLAALNGVLGDHLAASGNALATPMTLRYRGHALNWQAMPPKSEVSGKVLLLIHGLCMNDLQWHTTCAAGDVVDHGTSLAAALNATPIYLRYNTGLHTSTNGQLLSEQLQLLALHWPKPITELTFVVHSMGGLVARSAVHAAQRTDSAYKTSKTSWLPKLKSMVFLGTPHHGAPLEKAGNWVDVVLGSTPYSKPFAKLAQLRSAGITDLRFGHVVDEDWQGTDRFTRRSDTRTSVPLPEGVACFAVAGTTAGQHSQLADRLIGDGLVTLPSALGQHAQAARQLDFAKKSQYIAYRTNHMQLLSSQQVNKQLIAWLSK
jgi:pimeloyl-ACP methyl ester carboxylesterase